MAIPRPTRSSPDADGITLIELLVVITIVGALLALLLPAVQASREATRRSSCMNNLRQQAVALNIFHAANRRFPIGARRHERAGRESTGWHVMALPMLEQTALYHSISPRADGGATRSGAAQLPWVFVCPSAEPPTPDPNDIESANYVGIAGSGTSQVEWPLDEKVNGPVYTDGPLCFARGVAIGDITDGTSNTLMIGERTFFNTAEDWTYGATWYDANGTGKPAKIAVGAAKNLVWPINTIEGRRAAYLRDFTAPLSMRKIRNNDLPFGSRHPGGAAFALADGSVRFFNEAFNLSVLRRMASRDDGQVADAPP